MDRWITRWSIFVIGGVLGALCTVLFFSAGDFISRSAILVAVPLTAFCLVLYAIFRRVLAREAKRGAANWIGDGHSPEGLPHLVADAAEKFLPDGTKNREFIIKKLSQAAVGAENISRILAAIWGASTSLAAAIALTGAVVSMATLTALYQQIERLDLQNALLERQIDEATAARVSATFSAQLIPLLSEIEEARPSSRGGEWEVDRSLVTRIQTVIDLADPYATDPEADKWIEAISNVINSMGEVASPEWLIQFYSFEYGELLTYRMVPREQDGAYQPRLYSPERAKLFAILVGMQFPFDKIYPPLDFSFMDARDMSFSGPNKTVVVATDLETGVPRPNYSLGSTILIGGNFRNASFSGLDLSQVDFGGSVIERSSLLGNNLIAPNLSGELEFQNRSLGMNLLYSISPGEFDWPEEEDNGEETGADDASMDSLIASTSIDICFPKISDGCAINMGTALLEGYRNAEPNPIWLTLDAGDFIFHFPSDATDMLSEIFNTSMDIEGLPEGVQMGSPEYEEYLREGLTNCPDRIVSKLRDFLSNDPPFVGKVLVLVRFKQLLPAQAECAERLGLFDFKPEQ